MVAAPVAPKISAGNDVIVQKIGSTWLVELPGSEWSFVADKSILVVQQQTTYYVQRGGEIKTGQQPTSPTVSQRNGSFYTVYPLIVCADEAACASNNYEGKAVFKRNGSAKGKTQQETKVVTFVITL